MSTTADPWFQTLFADRIGGANYGKGTEIYKFEKIKRAKRAALAAHPERKLLDFGIGENDDMADPLVRDVAQARGRQAREPRLRRQRHRRLQGGRRRLHEAGRSASRSTRRPRSTTPSAPSRPCAMLPAVLHQPRRRHAHDRARLPRRRHAHRATTAARSTTCRCSSENGFYPDLDGIPADIKKRAKLLVINYPNSPTGAVATRDFYRQVIDFAHTQPDRRRAGRGPHPADATTARR